MSDTHLQAPARPQPVAMAQAKLPAGSYLTMLTTQRSLSRLEQSWRALEARCAVAPTVFQTFPWIASWNEIYGRPDSARELQIVAGYRNNQLVFAWPLMLQQRAGFKILSWLTEPIGQYGDALCDRDENASLWLQCATSYLKSLNAFDLLHLRHVRATSNFAPHAMAFWRDGRLNERAAAMNLTQFKSEADYDARYDSKQRKHRRRARTALEEFGPLSFTQLTDIDAIDAALQAATEQKLFWLQERGRFNTTMACPGHLQFLKRLARLPKSDMGLTVTQISVGARPISWEVCFASHGVQYCYLTAHAHEMTNHSPGRLHFDLAQRHWLAQGQRSYDLMVPYDPYKESWSSELEPVNDYYLPLSLKGRVYGGLYLGWLRPQARKLYQRLPASTLRVLKRVLKQ